MKGKGKGLFDHLPIAEVMSKPDGELNSFDKIRIKEAMDALEGAKDPGGFSVTFNVLKGGLRMVGNKATALRDKALEVGAETSIKDRIHQLEEIKQDRIEAKLLLDKNEISKAKYDRFIDELDTKEMLLNRD